MVEVQTLETRSESQEFPSVDLSSPQLTARAILTGMLIGALLTPCNIYSGLKIGWTFNMSVAAALLAYGFWHGSGRLFRTRPLGLLENNINQTTASSAASIVSAGFAAPIPAVMLLTGRELGWSLLAVWTFSVSLLGVVVAVGMRQQFLLQDKLPFPSGVATAHTVQQIYSRGREAVARVRALLLAGGAAAALKGVDQFLVAIPKIGVPGWVQKGVSLKNLGFALDPSLLLLGFGAIIGLRAGISLLIGSAVAWGILAPLALSRGWVAAPPADPGAFWFGPLVEWLLWPGVALMVSSALTSFALSWRSLFSVFRDSKKFGRSDASAHTVPRRAFAMGLLVAVIMAVSAQVGFFSIPLPAAFGAVALTFVLSIVAGRVSGETGITPIGAMGKVTQLTFGFLVPGSSTANLMSANVTGGATDQCADLLHDMKTGLLVGASPRFQTIAQVFGIFIGAIVGSAVFLMLIPDPQGMLLTEEWPAPAVATWKAVAEVLQQGIGAIPPASTEAMMIASTIGVALAVLAKTLRKDAAAWIPSASSIGLAFVIPAWNSLSMFAGAALAALVARRYPHWSARFLIVIAAGLVAGESLMGVIGSLSGMMGAD